MEYIDIFDESDEPTGKVKGKAKGLLIHEEKITINNIEIRKCTEKDVDEICNIENVVINNFKEEEKRFQI